MKQKLEAIFGKDGQRVAGLFVDPRSKIIYSLTSIKNKKHKFSTKVKLPNVAQAKRVANLRLSEIFGSNKKSITPLIKDEIPKYILLKESEGLDPKTLAVIRRVMRNRIEPFWGAMQTSEITRDKIPDWFASLHAKFPGEQHFNDVKYLRNFSKYLSETQHNGKALLPAVPRIVDPDHKRVIAVRKKKNERIFTKQEFRKIVKVASSTECILAYIMYTMATRIEETLNMKFGEQVIKKGRRWEYVWTAGQNKADHEGRHDFPNSMTVRLCERWEELNGQEKITDRLFPQQYNPQAPLRAQQIDWDGWRKRANLGWHWTSKTFRHTCLSNLFNNEKLPQALILKLYRISLAVALDVYVKPTESGREKMRNAIEAYL